MSNSNASQQPFRLSPSDLRQADNTNVTVEKTESFTQNNNLASVSLEDIRQLSIMYKGSQETGFTGLANAIIDFDLGTVERGVESMGKDLNAITNSVKDRPKDTSKIEPGNVAERYIRSLGITPGPSVQFDSEGARRYQQLHIPPPLGLPPLQQAPQGTTGEDYRN